MSKHKLLNEDDIEGYDLNPAILRLIHTYCQKNHISRGNIRILDYGSGRGRSVAILRNMGFLAYGVEIDPLPFSNGFNYFNRNGYHPDDFLFLMKEDCKTLFKDDFFDIIFSEQVFEHVENMEIVLEELYRITKKGGAHVHTFPAKYHLVEQHLYMPIIHWVPKNQLRKWLMYLFVTLGKEPFWESLHNKSAIEKTQVYYNYSVERTYYRSAKRIKGLLSKYGFTANHKYFHNTRSGIRGRIVRLFPWQVQINATKAK